MSSTYTWGFTNVTPSEAELAPTALGMATNYVKTTDEPTVAILKNSTTGLDQLESVTLKSRAIPRVDMDIPVYYPNPVKDGVLYGSRVQAVRREVRDDGSIVDHPIDCWVYIKHDIDSNWTKPDALSGVSAVGYFFRRVIGTLFHDDGSERFDALAKSALVPAVD